MLTGKQRSYLKALANPLRATVIIGKAGLSETVVKQIDDELTANELVKMSFLDTSGEDPKDVIDELISQLEAEFVSQLGNKLVLFRASKEHKIELP